MRPRLLAGLTALACLPALAACGSSTSPEAGSSASGSTTPSVVASTDVWGSVAKAVGGDLVKVTSVIDNPSQDPHDYEATAQDKLAFSKADVVVVNGGGYDDWATTLAKSTAGGATLVDAVKVSGLRPSGDGEFNEHVFYSMTAARKVATTIATDLSNVDPGHAATYRDNAKAFGKRLDELTSSAVKVGKAHPGSTAVATEPVVGYLLQDMSITNITPEAFVEQSETEAGPSTKVINETVTLLRDGKARVLLVNGQTVDDVSRKLSEAASASGTPTVGVHETFPKGVTTYDQFISTTIDAIGSALSK